MKSTALSLVALVITAAGIAAVVAPQVSGVKPTQVMQPEPEYVSDPTIEVARKALEENAADMSARKALAAALFTKISSERTPDRAEVLELLDTLSIILKAEPSDIPALLMMGEVSFANQVYQKAAFYYERYLSKEKADFAVRAKYAGSLAYIGKAAQAKGELERVLREQPTYFPAKVYLAVALSQLGEVKKAQTLLEQAATQTDSPEARSEILKLKERLLGEKAPPAPAAPSGTLEEVFRSNPVLGEKVVTVEVAGNAVVVTTKDFPAQMMPPVAKQKLAARVQDFYRQSQGNAVRPGTLRLVDQDGKHESLEIELTY